MAKDKSAARLMLEQFMSGYKLNEKGNLVVVNGDAADKAKKIFGKTIFENSRKWWVESKEDEVHDDCSTDALEKQPSNAEKGTGIYAEPIEEDDMASVGDDGSSDKGMTADEPAEDGSSDKGMTESFDFNSIFGDDDDTLEQGGLANQPNNGGLGDGSSSTNPYQQNDGEIGGEEQYSGGRLGDQGTQATYPSQTTTDVIGNGMTGGDSETGVMGVHDYLGPLSHGMNQNWNNGINDNNTTITPTPQDASTVPSANGFGFGSYQNPTQYNQSSNESFDLSFLDHPLVEDK